jgi:hypothetical protein
LLLLFGEQLVETRFGLVERRAVAVRIDERRRRVLGLKAVLIFAETAVLFAAGVSQISTGRLRNITSIRSKPARIPGGCSGSTWEALYGSTRSQRCTTRRSRLPSRTVKVQVVQSKPAGVTCAASGCSDVTAESRQTRVEIRRLIRSLEMVPALESCLASKKD